MNEVGIQRFGSLVIDRMAHEVTVDDLPVNLTNTEYSILTTLAEHPRRAFSSDHLMQVVTGSSWSDGAHALQVSVSRLRAKLGESGSQPRLIVTIHGFGYRFEPELTEPVSPFDVSAHLIVAIDRTILWADANCAHLTGWRSEAITGTSVYALVHDDDRPHAVAAKADLDAGEATTLMIRMRTATDGFVLVEAIRNTRHQPVVS